VVPPSRREAILVAASAMHAFARPQDATFSTTVKVVNVLVTFAINRVNWSAI
jgi:hypothetical protein